MLCICINNEHIKLTQMIYLLQCTVLTLLGHCPVKYPPPSFQPPLLLFLSSPSPGTPAMTLPTSLQVPDVCKEERYISLLMLYVMLKIWKYILKYTVSRMDNMKIEDFFLKLFALTIFKECEG